MWSRTNFTAPRPSVCHRLSVESAETYRRGAELQKDHIELLCTLVEASRNTPTKDVFMAMNATSGSTLGSVYHEGLPDRNLSVYIGDVQELVDLGLLAVRHYGEYQFNFDVSTLGFEVYEQVRQETDEPAEAMEKEMASFIRSREFDSRYPGAYGKWLDAQNALWSKQTMLRSTEIGHLCREALQEFAAGLVGRFGVTNADPNKTHAVARVRAVIDSLKAPLGQTACAFLDSLLNYWGCAQDLVQRQEHGAAEEQEQVIWEDARRVVFQTLITMYEVDRALTLVRR
jgi:hypothetical protein